MKSLTLLMILLIAGSAPSVPAYANKADCKGSAEDISRQANQITVVDVDEATGKLMQEKLISSYRNYYDALCDYATLEAAFKGTNQLALTKEEVEAKK